MKIQASETKGTDMVIDFELDPKDILAFKDNSKRGRLLRKHEDCLKLMTKALAGLETRTKEALAEAYLALVKVHQRLK